MIFNRAHKIRLYPNAGKRIDRDLNAAINIRNEGLNTEGSPEFKACEESVRPISVVERGNLVEAGSCD